MTKGERNEEIVRLRTSNKLSLQQIADLPTVNLTRERVRQILRLAGIGGAIDRNTPKVCAREGCGVTFRASTPFMTRKQVFCSRKCAAIVREARKAGG
ncbi:MAG: hypothetical protein A2W26_00575 [Acidobacteria bacterium RBG_16_64_8]|nr:MAG: hypothetical protein A2W26_00575 [Acidobacteria bacterium RBG_16_64_8]